MSAASHGLSRFIFGRNDFQENEEYLEFQFKFLCLVLISGALFTGIFLAGEHSNLNHIAHAHVVSMTAFTAISLALWLLLRGRKNWFTAIGWIYEFVCLAEYASALVHVSSDELRILWFYTNIPGVYILLGRRAGALATAISVGIIALGNGHLDRPYSQNAMATAIVSLLYLAVFFHVFASRSLSYFVRLQDSNRKLYHLAMHDTLTGVLNARAYYDLCDRLITLAKRSSAPYSVLFVDLDHFKAINDTYGHAAGDVVLKSVAACLGANIRESDALGRIGGEEFSIFLPNTGTRAAVQVGEKVRQAIEGLKPDIGDKRLTITASIGVACNRHSDQSMREIQQMADQAMYRAKAAGRNRVSAFEEAAVKEPAHA